MPNRGGLSLLLWAVPFLLGCVIGAPIEIQAAPPSDASDRPMRLLTYNLLHGGPASGLMRDESQLDARLEMAVTEIRKLNPDIIALQEVSQSRQYGDVPARLAERLGMYLAYAPATERLFGGTFLDSLVMGLIGFKEGVAVLSRFPIISSKVHDLPRCRRWYDARLVLEVLISTPSQRLQVFTTHPSRHAECQVPRIAELVKEQQGHDPSLLLGDLNAVETSVGSSLGREAGFVDVYRTANPDLPGPTVYQQIRVSRPTVFRRVDYIFVLPGPSWSAAVHSSRVVLDQPGGLADGTVLWPSDHYGVFAEVQLTRRDPSRAP